MASFLKSVFGSAEEEQKGDNAEDSNPASAQLSKEELAAKRMAHLSSALIPQPPPSQPSSSADGTTSDSPQPNEPNIESSSPQKKRRIDEDALSADPQQQQQPASDDEVAELSEEMKLAMQLSMMDDGAVELPPDVASATLTKRESFEYLSAMYCLNVRHSDLSLYKAHLANFSEFSHFIDNVNALCIIDDDTPISPSSVEAALIERFQRPFVTDRSSFKYLLRAYERCESFKERVRAYWSVAVPQPDQLQIVGDVQQCIVTFCGLSLSTPDLVDAEDFDASRLEFEHIMVQSPKGRDFPPLFLQRLFEQIEDDVMGDVLDGPLSLIKRASANVLRSNFGPAVNALMKLSQIESVALYLMAPEHGLWIPNECGQSIAAMKGQRVNANRVVTQSLIGGLLNLSYECPDIQPLFASLTMGSQDPSASAQIQSAFAEYRLITGELQSGIHSVFGHLIKTKQCKGHILRLFSYFIFLNMDRGKMRFDHQRVSGDGFMLNLNFVMLRLCGPIIGREKLMNKLDPRYFLIAPSSHYATWEDATRLSCDAQQLRRYTDALYDGGADSKSNDGDQGVSFGFTTEIFCLTLEALHLGFSCIYNEIVRLQRHIARMRREARANPMAEAIITHRVQMLEKRLLAQVAHIMDTQFVTMVGRFYSFLCKWILHLSRDQEHRKEYLGIIPEYYIEDMSRFFRLFMTERRFVVMMERGQQPFDRQLVIRCLIHLMGPQTPIRNIYQRACLSEVLLHFLPRKVLDAFHHGDVSWKDYEFENHEFNRFDSCQRDLVSTLLALYTEVERTGSPGQYYEKFKFRTIITQILKFLFKYKVHQNNVVSFWQSEHEKFISFLNMLINDLIYTLDHGFDGLTQIRQIESEPVNANDADSGDNPWNAANPFASPPQQNEAMRRQESIAELRDGIRHNMRMANESMELLGYVCHHTPEPFLDDLILPRIAVLVSVYLDRLAKGRELKVAKGSELVSVYNFKAKFLLSAVVKVFNKLCEAEQSRGAFLDAIVEDEAHFRESAYLNAINWLRKKQLLDTKEINAFELTLSIITKKFEEKRNIEVMLGDIPSKYLDPIMQTLMSDPVILGKNKNEQDTNKYVMDRKVIERHLMNNPNNPFNREPLTKEDLIPDTELKMEIEEWIKATMDKHKNNEEQKEQ